MSISGLNEQGNAIQVQNQQVFSCELPSLVSSSPSTPTTPNSNCSTTTAPSPMKSSPEKGVHRNLVGALAWDSEGEEDERRSKRRDWWSSLVAAIEKGGDREERRRRRSWWW
ncbi:hypothetical protein RND71_034961 [Anisodus tanguticus]|uniref:Uncharacterized protein n=1 Tax=Anisodus tanguticus TaxID=243964 RepID=A0AAE1V1R2_9SOLA|nr:hypothetical protein RND71_034961 [Anisodus tanguticus]